MEINRPLPRNIEAEQAVLGALIIEGSLTRGSCSRRFL